MKRLVALAALVALPAFAQSVNIKIDPNSATMDIQPPSMQMQMQTETKKSTVIEKSGDGYSLRYTDSDNGYTVLEVLEPEGAHVAIWDGVASVASDDAPMSATVPSDKWYRIEVTASNGAVWEKKIQAMGGMKGSLKVHTFVMPAAGPTRVVVQAAPPPPPPPPAQVGPAAMPDVDFNALIAAIERESFSKQKLDVWQSAASGSYFSVNQVGRIVDLFSFGNDKVQAVAIAKSRIVDRNNAFSLYGHFTFSGDKDKVKAILGQ